MSIESFLIATSYMLALGGVLAGVLVLANKKLHVFEDPRIDDVESMLPGNNCGACGFPGCRAFSEKVVLGDITPARCTVCTPESREEIAEYLGVSVGAEEKRVARLACAGGSNVSRQRVEYKGLVSCQAAALATGGGKGCSWGCLGHGDCADVCGFDAITMNENRLPVVDEDKCTACGDCVEICPKDLFSIQPAGNRLWVACKSEAEGDDAEAECRVACTGCGLCAADAPAGLISMKKNLPAIDYSKRHLATKRILQRCPTGAIVWLEDGGRITRGKSAKRIVRSTPLPVG